MACGIYVSIDINLLKGESSQTAYREGIERESLIYQVPYFKKELPNFDRVMSGSLANLSELFLIPVKCCEIISIFFSATTLFRAIAFLAAQKQSRR